MCLIAAAWRCSERFPLVIAANRDELHERPTLMAAPWRDAPEILGGRDLLAGGGWLALSRRGRLAAVTNLRRGERVTAARSRGELVRDFLLDDASAPASAAAGLMHANDFGPYNLLLWDGDTLVHATNRPEAACAPLRAGLHGLSNGPIDADWPKVRRLKDRLGHWLGTVTADAAPDVAPLFSALADEQGAPDADLPDTGLGLDVERRLAPAFIRNPHYGTRASTVVLLDSAGHAQFLERSFAPGGDATSDVRLECTLESRT